MNTANEIEILVRARTPLVYIYNSEERRVLETLKSKILAGDASRSG
jgi:hypothetical protein